jgi:hypothetical protein
LQESELLSRIWQDMGQPAEALRADNTLMADYLWNLGEENGYIERAGANRLRLGDLAALALIALPVLQLGAGIASLNFSAKGSAV